ncbi:hypothetical protein BPOR_0281g00060 [Botrytis porri]|uniref:Uncharacterized protein n=1 Tax=Botrytis porri TaxID=87229 RepID=A0A4Z1KKY2_9HELO|nr:hypothetical protein BPOR_0281g00060 [Botrytis porri]
MSRVQAELPGPNTRPDIEKHEAAPHVVLLECLGPSDFTFARKIMIEIVRTNLEFLVTLTNLVSQAVLAMDELGMGIMKS